MTNSILQVAAESDPVTVYASSTAGPVAVLLDRFDAERLGNTPISIGSHGYAQRWHRGQNTPIHRWIMGCERGDGQYVDHLNGDRYDCRRTNLRTVTAQQNAANRRCTALSGHLGVYQRQRSRRWTAQGKVNGVNFHLGTFDTPEEAARVAHAWRLNNLPGYLGRNTTTVPAPKRAAA